MKPKQNTHAEDFPLLDHLDGLVHELRRLVPSALRGENVDAVHDARVSTRRLRAATQLLDPLLSRRCRKPFDKVTRSLRRRLGPLRDLDVMLDRLQEIKSDKFQPAAAWMIQRLTDKRQTEVKSGKRHGRAARLLGRLGTWWGVRHEIVVAQDAIGHLVSESVHHQLDAFADQAAHLGHGDPHALRIAGKSLRYTLELARAHGLPLPVKVMSLFKKMQEFLGLWHDDVVLTDHILAEAAEADLALHDPALTSTVLKLAQTTLQHAESHLAHMAALWQQRGDDLCGQIRAAFELPEHHVPAETIDEVPGQSPAEIAEELPATFADPAIESPEEPVSNDAQSPAMENPEAPPTSGPSAQNSSDSALTS